MSEWALILGVSSGFGAAAAKELAKNNINIYGVHLDRKAAMDDINKFKDELKNNNVEVIFKNASATEENIRQEIISELINKEDVRIKVFLHSLAFGALKPVFDETLKSSLNQKQIEMTLNVMGSSLIYWSQNLFYSDLLKQGSQIFAMTSSGGHRQWKAYGAVSAAKAALESYCRQLAIELGPYNIACNALQAGVTDTPALRKIPGNEIMIENTLNINPSKRLTTPEDLSKIILMIGLSENTWMTGNTIRVDGGEDIAG
jgi:NAD(P)-dependent dehydrogenase (short-subunit alcohol dehydrogenase family)